MTEQPVASAVAVHRGSARHGKAAPLAVTLVLAAGAWVVAIRQMDGMDMGVATELGSFSSFVALWASMMAAMMLPAAAPAVARVAGGGLRAGPRFVAAYLAVWLLVGIPVYALHRPHGELAAGVAVIVAGVYELTPVKRLFREQCRAPVGSGFGFGLCCVGSSIGLMVVLVMLGLMSPTWMTVISVVVLTQKLLPPRAAIDVPFALAMVAFGVLIVVSPSSAPGLTS